MHQDALAVEAVKAGDRERYEELVGRYERMVYGIAWSRLGRRDLSEDVVQETFVQGFRFLATLRKPGRFASWIGRIARNISSTVARRRRLDAENESRWILERGSTEVAPASAQGEPLTDVLREVLEHLPEKHREAIVLYYLQEKSVRECARALGVSESSFKVRMHRARKALRTEMETHLERSLRNLRPKEGLSRRVIAVVPAAPIASGVAGLGWLSALAGLAVLQFAPLALLLAWGHRQTVANYRGERNYRRVARRRIWRQGLLIMVVGVVFTFSMHVFYGPRAIYLALVLFFLPALVRAFLLLRVNRTGFARANALGLAAMLTALCVIAIGGPSYFWCFLAAILICNVALWRGRKSMPGRQDYSLLLREASQELGHVAEAPAAGRRGTSEDMRRFARLLGGLLLITDYSVRGDECLCALPPVTANALAEFWPWRHLALASRLVIGSDGGCSVTINDYDWREIQAIHSAEAASRPALEARTAEAAEQAWAFFLRGDEAQARAILQPKSDEEILIRPVHELSSMKVGYVLAIGCGALALTLWLVRYGSKFLR